MYKHTTAQKHSSVGKYPSTFFALWGIIPDDIKISLTGKQIAALIDLLWAQKQHGENAAYEEFKGALEIEHRVCSAAPKFESFRALKDASGMTLTALSDALGIPYRTLQDWSRGIRIPPAYVLDLIAHRLRSLGYLKEEKQND